MTASFYGMARHVYYRAVRNAQKFIKERGGDTNA